MKLLVAATLALGLVARVAHAGGDEEMPRRIDLAHVDLSLPHARADGRGEHVSLTTAKAVRATGIALTFAGLAASIAGTTALLKEATGDSRLSYRQTFDLGVGGLGVGTSGLGAGIGLWAFGDLEVRRAEGRTPMLAQLPRGQGGPTMKIAGAALLGVGLVLGLSAIIPVTTVSCSNGNDCGFGAAISSAVLGGTGALFIGAGIPLLAVGLRKEHDGRTILTLDTVAPRVMPGGGGIGFSGRF